MKRVVLVLALLGTALSATGCIVAPYPGYYRGGYCYYHPYRCY